MSPCDELLTNSGFDPVVTLKQLERAGTVVFGNLDGSIGELDRLHGTTGGISSLRLKAISTKDLQ